MAQDNAGSGDGQRVKIEVLTSREPQDWRPFRSGIEVVCEGNNYSNKRAISEVYTHLSLHVREAVQHVTRTNADGSSKTLKQYLDDCESVFLSPQASALAEAEFEIARQGAEESLLDFHGRLRNLFLNAFPELGEGFHTNRILIKRFVNGLRDPLLGQHTAQREPRDYTAALHAAQSSMAILLEQKRHHPDYYKESSNSKGLHALGMSSQWSGPPSSSHGFGSSSAPSSGTTGGGDAFRAQAGGAPNRLICSYCGYTGHTISSPCRFFLADSAKRKEAAANNSRGNGRRGSGSRRGGKRRNNGGNGQGGANGGRGGKQPRNGSTSNQGGRVAALEEDVLDFLGN